MSTQGTHPIWIDSFEAVEAIPQYAVVVYHSDGKIKLPAAAKAKQVVGVTQEAATASGDIVPVVRLGSSYVNAGSSGTIGRAIGIHDTQGRVSTPTAFVSGDGYVGHWEEAPNASGDQVVAFINPAELVR